MRLKATVRRTVPQPALSPRAMRPKPSFYPSLGRISACPGRTKYRIPEMTSSATSHVRRNSTALTTATTSPSRGAINSASTKLADDHAAGDQREEPGDHRQRDARHVERHLCDEVQVGARPSPGARPKGSCPTAPRQSVIAATPSAKRPPSELGQPGGGGRVGPADAGQSHQSPEDRRQDRQPRPDHQPEGNQAQKPLLAKPHGQDRRRDECPDGHHRKRLEENAHRRHGRSTPDGSGSGPRGARRPSPCRARTCRGGRCSTPGASRPTAPLAPASQHAMPEQPGGQEAQQVQTARSHEPARPNLPGIARSPSLSHGGENRVANEPEDDRHDQQLDRRGCEFAEMGTFGWHGCQWPVVGCQWEGSREAEARGWNHPPLFAFIPPPFSPQMADDSRVPLGGEAVVC